jgi:hypothetical protein
MLVNQNCWKTSPVYCSDEIIDWKDNPKWQQAEEKRLFEGWDYDSYENAFYKDDTFIYIGGTGNDNEISLRWGEYEWVIVTLNDFITLCNLAEVELNWNPENKQVKELNLI